MAMVTDRRCWYCGTPWRESRGMPGVEDCRECPECHEEWLSPEDDESAAIHDDARTAQYFDPNTSDKRVHTILVDPKLQECQEDLARERDNGRECGKLLDQYRAEVAQLQQELKGVVVKLEAHRSMAGLRMARIAELESELEGGRP